MPIIYLCRPADLVYLVFGLVSGHGAPSSDLVYLVFGLASGLGAPFSDLVYLVFGLVSGHDVPSSGLACGLASGLGHHVLNLVRREGACLQYPNFDGLSNTLYHANLSNSYENHDEVFDDDPIYDLPTYEFCNYLSNEDILLHTKTEHLDK